jgi:hypothetical protein
MDDDTVSTDDIVIGATINDIPPEQDINQTPSTENTSWRSTIGSASAW